MREIMEYLMKNKEKLLFSVLVLLSLLLFINCEKIKANKVLKWYYTSDYVDEEGNQPIAGFGGNMLLSGNKLFATRGGKMVCFDKDNGEILWYYDTGLYLNDTPVLADNKIFILNGSNELRLTVLDLNGNVPNDYTQVVYDNFETMGNTISAVGMDKIYIDRFL